jgi:hypothetical protein
MDNHAAQKFLDEYATLLEQHLLLQQEHERLKVNMGNLLELFGDLVNDVEETIDALQELTMGDGTEEPPHHVNYE